MTASSNSSNTHASSSRRLVSNCFCGARAPIRRAWTITNFGKSFARYGRYLHQDACGYFIWVDTEICPRGREFEAKQKFQDFEDELGDSRALIIELQNDIRRNIMHSQSIEDRIVQKNRHIASISSELAALKINLRFYKSVMGCSVVLFFGLVIRFFYLRTVMKVESTKSWVYRVLLTEQMLCLMM
ncbi:hypothetical protein M5689_006329 [Euphorbia peplus]|nr:hypothetical protein M5689_006329 [Euphorbia peplus]